MFEKSGMLFMYTESSLHAGAGRGFGAIDLPIQRERVTGYPMIQAGGVKGRLRSAFQLGNLVESNKLAAFFGPEGEKASEHAGALSIGDARIALFPVRSLAGVFAWVTCLDVLARLRRAATQVGLTVGWTLPEEPPAEGEAWTSDKKLVSGNEVIVLEEFDFTNSHAQKDFVISLATWLASQALLDAKTHPEYKYFADNLASKICIVSDTVFRDFVLYGTEVQTHIHLDPVKKTVLTGQLWTTESLPCDALLYAPVLATRSRKADLELSGAAILSKFDDCIGKKLERLNFGGDETTGLGVMALRFAMGSQEAAQ